MPEILSIGELLDLGNSANMSAYIPYSGLEYNASGSISGISGSAIAGGIESSVVSSIVSSMVSGKADQSAVEDCCSAMSAEVSAKLDATASSLFQPSGNYQPSGDYYSATNPSGFITTADLTDYAKESALSSKLDASASSNFAPSGDYVLESSYSSFTSEVTNNITSISSTVSGLTGDYLEKSASSMFAPSGEYAYESSLSSYIPESASGQFAPSGNYADSSALTSYIPFSAVSGADSKITAINGSAIGGTGSEFTGVVTDDTLTGNGLPDSALGVDNYNVLFDSSLYSSLAGNNVTIGVQSGIYQPSGDYYPASNPSGFISSVDLSNYATTGYVDSSVSGKLDSSASSSFYTTDNPSGFITGVDLSNYATTGYVDSSVSGKLDSSASSSFYTTDNPSGFITGVDLSNYATTAYVDSSVSGKQDSLTFAYDDDKISAINGSALAGQGGATGDYVEKSATEVAIGSNVSAYDVSLAQGYYSVASGDSFAQGDWDSASSKSFAQGDRNTAYGGSLAQGQTNKADLYSLAQGISNSASSEAMSQGYYCSAGYYSFAQGNYNSSRSYSFAQGDKCLASSHGFAAGMRASAIHYGMACGSYLSAYKSTAFGEYNLQRDSRTSPSAVFVIGDGTADSARHDLMIVTKTGEIVVYSSTSDTVGTGILSSIRAVSSDVSEKLDSSASSSFYTTDNPSGFITDVDLSNYATTAYVDSSVSGKQDTLTFAYDVDKISAINGSALAGGGGGGATGDYYEKSATEIAYGPSATATNSSLSIGLASSTYGSIAINSTNYSTADSAAASVGSVAVGQRCTAQQRSLSLGRYCSANQIGIAIGDTAVAYGGSLSVGYSTTASSCCVAAGLDVSAKNTAVAFGKYNLRGNGNASTGDSAAFVIGDGTAAAARHDLMLVTKDGEITMYSGTADTVGLPLAATLRAISAWAVTNGWTGM